MDKLKTYSNVNKKFAAKGMLNYKLILFIAIYICIIYQLLDFFNVDIISIIYILFLSMIPMFGIYFTVSKEENFVEVLLNIFRYLIKPKIYVYTYEQKQKYFCKYKFKYKKYGCKNK